MALNRIVSLILVLAIAISLVTPVMYASTSGIVAYDELAKLRLEAKLLRNMIERLLSVANISEDLRLKIEDLLKVNIDNLTYKELKLYIEKLKEVLKILKESIRSERLVNATKFVEKLKEIVRKRLEKTAKKLNISKEELRTVLNRLKRVHTLVEMNRLLALLRSRLLPLIVMHNARAVELYIENKSTYIELVGAVRAIDVAMKTSSLAIKMLNTLMKKLSMLNVTAPIVEIINESLEKLKIAHDLLKEIRLELSNVSKQMGANVSIVVKRAIENVRTRIATKLLHELLKLRKELYMLREAAIVLNRTDIVSKLDDMIAKIDKVVEAIKNGKKVNTRTLLQLMIQAKKLEAKIRGLLHRYHVREEVSYRLREEVGKLSKELRVLRNRIKSLLRECVRLGLENLTAELKKALNVTNALEKEIVKALESIERGNVSLAVDMIKDTKTKIESVLKVEKCVERRLRIAREKIKHEFEDIMKKAKRLEKQFREEVGKLRSLMEAIEKINTTLANEIRTHIAKFISSFRKSFDQLHYFVMAQNITGARVAVENLVKVVKELETFVNSTITLVSIDIEKLAKTLRSELNELLTKVRNISNIDIEGLKSKVSEVEHEIAVLIDKLDKLRTIDIVHRIYIVIEVENKLSEIKHVVEHLIEIDHEITSVKKELTEFEKRLHRCKEEIEKVERRMGKNVSSMKGIVERIEKLIDEADKIVMDIKEGLKELALDKVRDLLNTLNEMLNVIESLLEELGP